MIKIIFEEDNGVRRFAGYSNLDYSSDSEEEIVREVSEDELDSLVPDSFEGGWKENKAYFKLDSNGEIVFDEGYTPPEPTSGGQ